MNTNFGKLTLIGAGPGDPELITVKGMKALSKADVVLYDALTNPLLLDYASSSAQRMFVGKRRGIPSMEQAEINELILNLATSGYNIARLKGGDPFVFGRGMEEVLFARAHGLEVETISGVSSCIAAPATAGIPITHRGVSDSFWVLAGNKADGSLSHDLLIAMKSNATVVVLMGLAKSSEIGNLYQQGGKGDTPAAIIYEATLPEQAVSMGRVRDLGSIAGQCRSNGPATIVIGEAVRLAANREFIITANEGNDR